MNVLERIGAALSPTRKDASDVIGATVGVAGAGVHLKRRDPRKQVEAYTGWVNAAAGAVARTVAENEWELSLGVGDERQRIDVHPWLDVWEKPYPGDYGFGFRVQTVLSMLLTGDAYWYQARTPLQSMARGGPAELWPLLPQHVTIVPDKQEFVKGYIYEVAGERVAFERDEVVHFKLPSPRSIYYGMGVVEAAAHSIDLMKHMADYSLATFRNRAVPAIVLSLDANLRDDDMTPAQRRRLVAEWDNLLRGTDKSQRTASVLKGLKVDRLALTPQELDYLRGKEYNRDEIFAMFGVHRSIVGMADDINRANAEAATYTMAKYTTKPLLTLLRDPINAEIIDRYDPRLHFDYVDPVPENEELKLKQAEVGSKTRALVRNEVRDLLGQDARDEGDSYLMGMTERVVPAGEELEEPVEEPEDEPEEDPQQEARSKQQRNEKLAARLRGVPRRILDPIESDARKRLSGFFEGQKKRVIGKLRNQRSAWVERRFQVDEVFDENEERLLLGLIAAGIVAGAWRAGLDLADEVLGFTAIAFEADEIQRSISEQANAYARTATTTTKNQLDTALRKVADSGGSLGEAVEAAEGVFDTAVGIRALTGGRMETSVGFHRAQMGSYRAGGVPSKSWSTMGDGRVTPMCEANEHDGVIPLQIQFSSGDTEPPVGEHAGCRCVLVPEMEPERAAPAPTVREVRQVVRQAESSDAEIVRRALDVAEKAASQPVTVNVAPAQVKVAPAKVDVHTPDVKVDVHSPVTMPEVQVVNVPGKGARRVVRDAEGKIAGVEEV